jgi:ATP-dependent DNA helicase PIF1
MMNSLPTPEVKLVAEDSVDCAKYLRKRVEKQLKAQNDDCSNTAGLDDVLLLKIGARVMLRRNIDVGLGLVNGAIGTLTRVNWDLDKPTRAKTITIKFNHGLEHQLEPVRAKFMVMQNAFVHRTQFPISVAYAITIHKSQGLSLTNVLLDIGSSVFSCGQAYVALSRVTTLEGLHLINFDPSQVKALQSALCEINRLRVTYRPDLQCVTAVQHKHRRVRDQQWATKKQVEDIQEQPTREPKLRKGRSRRDKYVDNLLVVEIY